MFWSKVQYAVGITLASGAILFGIRMPGSADGAQPAAQNQVAADPPKAGAPKPNDPAAQPAKADPAAQPKTTDAAKAQEMLKKAVEALAKNPQDPQALKLIQDAQNLLLKKVQVGPTSPGALQLGGGSESMSVQVGNGTFTILAQKSGVKFNIEGTAAADGGKPMPTRIQIEDGNKKVDAATLDKVPAEYRERVMQLLAGVNGGM